MSIDYRCVLWRDFLQVRGRVNKPHLIAFRLLPYPRSCQAHRLPLALSLALQSLPLSTVELWLPVTKPLESSNSCVNSSIAFLLYLNSALPWWFCFPLKPPQMLTLLLLLSHRWTQGWSICFPWSSVLCLELLFLFLKATQLSESSDHRSWPTQYHQLNAK